MNQELEIYLRFYVNSFHDNWHKWLPLAEFSYNDKIHSTTSVSPHYATLGFHPWKGDPRQVTEPRNPAGSDFAAELQMIRERAHESLKAAQATAKAYYDRKRGKSWDFKDGDVVWLDGTHITPATGIKKLSPRRPQPSPPAAHAYMEVNAFPDVSHPPLCQSPTDLSASRCPAQAQPLSTQMPTLSNGC